VAGGQISRVVFVGADPNLNAAAQESLRRVVALLGTSERRIQINAYAAGTQETISAARRLALSRALNARAYLIEQGVRSTRIDVNARGLAEDGGPADRVDVVLLPQ
jgi:outer membrane protein OmpA-like peptidoglycan-associated protein